MAKIANITLLTVEQASAKLNMPVWRVRKHAKTDPSFPTKWLGKKTVRVVAEGLPAWLDTLEGTYKG